MEATLFSSKELTPCVACLCVAPTGEVYAGIDQIGSLGKGAGFGRILRLTDQDNDGVVALDEFLNGTVPSGSIDLDGNGQYDALTDGLLLLRGMFGLNGDALITGTLASDALYTSSEDIETRIELLNNLADVDGNGQIDALTDGLLVLRYLFGLQGEALISDVIAADATRTSSAEIEAHLASLTPSI